MVYFVRSGRFIKIGYTGNLNARLGQLGTSSPTVLQVLAVVDGDRDTEVAYHERWAKYRSHGEWFKYGPEIKEFLEHEVAALNIQIKQKVKIPGGTTFIMTNRAVEAIRPKETRKSYWDAITPGLQLRVGPSGYKSWSVVYRFNGRVRIFTIGKAGFMNPVPDAREKARRILKLVEDGRDPAGEKKAWSRGSGEHLLSRRTRADDVEFRESARHEAAAILACGIRTGPPSKKQNFSLTVEEMKQLHQVTVASLEGRESGWVFNHDVERALRRLE